jgi:hypothetical protein
MFTLLFTSTTDPVDDLIERIRHPVIWTIKHPLRALGYRVRGTFSAL